MFGYAIAFSHTAQRVDGAGLRGSSGVRNSSGGAVEFVRSHGEVAGIASPDCVVLGDTTADGLIVGSARLDGRHLVRNECIGRGTDSARVASDLALIATTYRLTGSEGLGRLRGDWAIVVWDPMTRTVVAARSPLGTRLLYYHASPTALVIADSIAALRAWPGVSSALSDRALHQFLAAGVDEDPHRTTFSDVRRLPSGCLFTCHLGSAEPTVRRFWDFPTPAPLVGATDGEIVEMFRVRIDDAVRDRTSEGGASILLSGGLDSTNIAASVRRVDATGRHVAVTNVIHMMDDAGESELAKQVARRLGLAHVVLEIGTGLPLAHLDDPSLQLPEPVDDPDVAGWRSYAAQLSQYGSVVLYGEDGDALLHPPSLLATLQFRPTQETMWSWWHYRRRMGRWPWWGVAWRRRLRAFMSNEGGVPTWMRLDAPGRAPLTELSAPSARQRARPVAAKRLLGPIWQTVHERDDPAVTGVPLDVRLPLLDTRLIEFVMSIPPVPWCQNKELLRRAGAPELPDVVLQRPKTPVPGFYALQVARWRATWSGALVLDARLEPFVHRERVVAALSGPNAEHVVAAWRVLMLNAWLRGVT